MSIFDSILTSLSHIPAAPGALQAYLREHTVNDAFELSSNNLNHFFQTHPQVHPHWQAITSPVLTVAQLVCSLPIGMKDFLFKLRDQTANVPAPVRPIAQACLTPYLMGLGLLQGSAFVMDQAQRLPEMIEQNEYQVGRWATLTLGTFGLLLMGMESFGRGSSGFMDAMGEGRVLAPAGARVSLSSALAAIPASGLAEVGASVAMMNSKPLTPEERADIQNQIAGKRDLRSRVAADQSLTAQQQEWQLARINEDIQYLTRLLPVEERRVVNLHDDLLVNVPGGRFVRGKWGDTCLVEVSGFRMARDLTSWWQILMFQDANLETPFAVLGRSVATELDEVIQFGESEAALGEIRRSYSEEGSGYVDVQIQRVIPEEGFRVPDTFRIPGETEAVPERFLNHPANVNHHEARAFSYWWGVEHFGVPGRLSTEAEWNYAAVGDPVIVPANLSGSELMEFFGGPEMEVMGRQGTRLGRYEVPVILDANGAIQAGAQIFMGHMEYHDPTFQRVYQQGVRIGVRRTYSTLDGSFDPLAICSSVFQHRNMPWQVNEGLGNVFGIRDLSGSLCEWVSDWNAPYQNPLNRGEILVNPKGSLSSVQKTLQRVTRGGCWLNDFATSLNAADRGWGFVRRSSSIHGFRVVIPQ